MCMPPMLARAGNPVSKQEAKEEIFLAVVLNNNKLSDTTLICAIDNRIFVPYELLIDARLHLSDALAIERHHKKYYPLDAIPGMHAETDTSTQTLTIQIPSAAFVSSVFNALDRSQSSAQISETGAFLNYDINVNKVQSQNNTSGMAELGIFSGSGTYTSRFLSINVNNERTTFRLDSQYVRDFPQQKASMVIGDSITGISSFARQVYFGGLQWKTKFDTVPGFQSIPLPTLSGTAAAPSIVDIYINNILQFKQAVETGPFTIHNLPVSAGQGNLQMVVRDVLGRQQVTTQSYIASSQLLKEGTPNVSIEIGALRNNFGTPNSSYGKVFSSGTLRYGVSDSTTVETHGEMTSEQQSMGIGSVVAIPNLGLLSAGLVASHSARGSGTQQYLQFDHSEKYYAVTIRAQTAGARFWQLGLDDNLMPTAKQLQVQTSVAIGEICNLALGYLSQVNRSTDSVRSINAGVNFNLRQSGSVSIGVLKSLKQDRSLSTNVVWIIPLGHQSILQVSAGGQSGSKFLSTEYQQTAAQEGGWGFRARKEMVDTSSEDVGVNYIGPTGEYTLTANHAYGQNNEQLEARGGIALLGGHVRATRWLDQSFAIVEVPINQAIDIYANNVKVGQTDKNGVGFVPRLIPYEVNNVYLDDSGLPLSISLELAQKSIVPTPRSGSLLTFSAQKNQSAILVLQDKNGKPLATGTHVYFNGKSEATKATKMAEVALRGQVFIPDIVYPATIVVDSDVSDSHCRLTIATPAQTESLPRLGPFICNGEMK